MRGAALLLCLLATLLPTIAYASSAATTCPDDSAAVEAMRSAACERPTAALLEAEANAGDRCARPIDAAPASAQFLFLFPGAVSEKDARLVFEANATGHYFWQLRRCTLSSPASSPGALPLHGQNVASCCDIVQSSRVPTYEARPYAVAVSSLEADTTYELRVSPCAAPADAGHSAALRFKTLSLDAARPVELIVVGCNEAPTVNTLWRQLGDRLADPAFDGHERLCSHIGDNVYADDAYLAWTWLRDDTHAAAAHHSFAQIYRDHFGNPDQRRAMALCHNRMISDDHEVIDDYGRYKLPNRFVAEVALQAILTYQQQLTQDIQRLESVKCFFGQPTVLSAEERAAGRLQAAQIERQQNAAANTSNAVAVFNPDLDVQLPFPLAAHLQPPSASAYPSFDGVLRYHSLLFVMLDTRAQRYLRATTGFLSQRQRAWLQQLADEVDRDFLSRETAPLALGADSPPPNPSLRSAVHGVSTSTSPALRTIHVHLSRPLNDVSAWFTARFPAGSSASYEYASNKANVDDSLFILNLFDGLRQRWPQLQIIYIGGDAHLASVQQLYHHDSLSALQLITCGITAHSKGDVPIAEYLWTIWRYNTFFMRARIDDEWQYKATVHEYFQNFASLLLSPAGDLDVRVHAWQPRKERNMQYDFEQFFREHKEAYRTQVGGAFLALLILFVTITTGVAIAVLGLTLSLTKTAVREVSRRSKARRVQNRPMTAIAGVQIEGVTATADIGASEVAAADVDPNTKTVHVHIQ